MRASSGTKSNDCQPGKAMFHGESLDDNENPAERCVNRAKGVMTRNWRERKAETEREYAGNLDMKWHTPGFSGELVHAQSALLLSCL